MFRLSASVTRLTRLLLGRLVTFRTQVVCCASGVPRASGQRIARGIERDSADVAAGICDVRLRDHAVAVHGVGELVGAAVGQGLPGHPAVGQVPHIGEINDLAGVL